MSMRRTVSIGALLLSLTGSTVASADPITITGGMFRLAGFAHQEFNSVSFSLQGDQGFAISGVQSDGAFERFPTACAIVPCAAGTTTSAQQALGFVNALGTGTIGGTASAQTLANTGDFVFHSGLVTIPQSTAEFLALTSPFTFTGTLAIDAITGARTPIGAFALAGAGTATTNLQRVGDAYAVTSFTYEFAAANPTPEPGSLLLLASGAVLVLRRVRRTGTTTMEGCHPPVTPGTPGI